MMDQQPPANIATQQQMTASDVICYQEESERIMEPFILQMSLVETGEEEVVRSVEVEERLREGLVEMKY